MHGESIKGLNVFQNKLLNTQSWKKYLMGGYYCKKPHLTDSMQHVGEVRSKNTAYAIFNHVLLLPTLSRSQRADATSL